MRNLRSLLLGLCLVSGLAACDNNVFEPVENPKPADEATAYMDQGKPDEAISVLNKALAKDPENYQLISILASAKAQKAGVDTIDIVVRLAEDGVSGDNGFAVMFSILPPVTLENRRLLQEVVELMASIPEALRTDGDNLKATLYNASYMALQAKFFDSDGDGSFTAEELANLDDESADAIVNSLLSAENAAGLFQGAEQNGVAAEKVKEIKAQLDAQPGDTNAEKLRNLLAAQNG